MAYRLPASEMMDGMRDLVDYQRARRAPRRGLDLLIAIAIIGWGRLSSRHVDPIGPDALDWVGTLLRSLEFQVGILVALLLLGYVRRRSWLRAAIAGALVAWTVAVPLLHGSSQRAPVELDGATLRVLSINVLVHNADVEPTAEVIRDVDADVVLVQEYGKAWERKLPDELDGWTAVQETPRDDSFGVAIFVRDELVDDAEGSSFPIGPDSIEQAEVRLEVDGEPARIYGIHLRPPISPTGYVAARQELQDLLREIEQVDAPTVVVGDFNAVGGSAIDRAMQDAELRDSWEIAGAGPGWTYPAKSFLRFLPGIRIDHAYVDDHWEVVHAELLPGHGSDHRPLLVDLVLTGR